VALAAAAVTALVIGLLPLDVTAATTSKVGARIRRRLLQRLR
jgi:hypothetical protein